ncbi:hypothetical protein KM043_001767 [Ampulex compressa]|nr:hypothetical protein KM043_001767 [Ampulex compressa]
MSVVVNSWHTDHLINKEGDFSFCHSEKEAYNFKYVPESHFKCIVKSVQRRKCKEEEERIWSKFIRQQESNGLNCAKRDIRPSMRCAKELLQESIDEVDRELKRLKEEAIPNGSKSIREENDVLTNTKRRTEKVLSSQNGAVPLILKGQTMSTCDDSQESQEDYTPNLRKSLSDLSVRRGTNVVQRHFDKASNAQRGLKICTLFDDKIEKSYCVKLDPIMAQKVLTIQSRVSELLDEILFRLCTIPLPEDDRDLKRRQQRATEFAIRFSRNYLYDLHRQIADIRRHTNAAVSAERAEKGGKGSAIHTQAAVQKLLSAHQLLLHALVAYCKHIPGSILIGHLAKLKEVLEIVINLSEACRKLQIFTCDIGSGDTPTSPLEKNVEIKCNNILSKLKLISNSRCQLPKHSSGTSKMKCMTALLTNKKNSYCKDLPNRFSMYSMNCKIPKCSPKDRKGGSHKKKTGHSVVHREESQSSLRQLSEQLYPSPATNTSSSKDTVRNHCGKHNICIKEDNIQTMMDIALTDSESDSDSSKKTKVVHTTEGGIEKEDDAVERVTTIAEQNLSSLVPIIADLMTFIPKKENSLEDDSTSEPSTNVLLACLQKYQSAKQLSTNVKDDDPHSCAFNANVEHECRNKTSKGDGENMRLIVMTSEDDNGEILQRDISHQGKPREFPKTHNAKAKDSVSKDTVGPLVKGGVHLDISEKTASEFLKYRHQYLAQCQSRPMYSGNNRNKPWDIVVWISDKLVDELLVDVAKELEIRDVIQKLFELEFREF